jgi:hypothetical protein
MRLRFEPARFRSTGISQRDKRGEGDNRDAFLYEHFKTSG